MEYCFEIGVPEIIGQQDAESTATEAESTATEAENERKRSTLSNS
jgi:hypothetical protein